MRTDDGEDAGGALERLRATLEGTYVPPRKDAFDIGTDTLYGAIGGLELHCPHFDLLPGLRLRSTFCRVIAPYLMAFAPPPRPGLPHPNPWVALGEGGLTVLTELELTADAEAIGFDRLNTVWFVVALLRLRLGQPLQVPVIADRPFSVVKSAPESANIIPVELGAPLVRTTPHRGATQSDLQWIQSHLRAAAALMQDPIFNRALQTFDRAVAVPYPGAGIVIAWASIESLLRPGQQRITERLCRALATLLHPPGSTRDRAFTEIAACYEARGGAAHAGHMPDTKQFTKAFDLARAALMATIEQGRLPCRDELLRRWSQKL